MTTPWRQRFAQRTQRKTISAVRELLKITQQPDVISFAGGLHPPELFPIEEFRAAAEQVLKSAGPKALQYSTTEGYPPFLLLASKWKQATECIRVGDANCS